MAWAKNGTPDTLTTSGDTLTISDLTASTFNQLMSYQIQTGGQAGAELSFNSDSGSNYTRRWGGSSSGTDISQTKTNYYYNGVYPVFAVTYFINISSEEKLFIGNFLSQNASGAGNAPLRIEIVNKWANTSEQITTVTMNNTNSGDFAIDSNLTALGTD